MAGTLKDAILKVQHLSHAVGMSAGNCLVADRPEGHIVEMLDRSLELLLLIDSCAKELNNGQSILNDLHKHALQQLFISHPTLSPHVLHAIPSPQVMHAVPSPQVPHVPATPPQMHIPSSHPSPQVMHLVPSPHPSPQLMHGVSPQVQHVPATPPQMHINPPPQIYVDAPSDFSSLNPSASYPLQLSPRRRASAGSISTALSHASSFPSSHAKQRNPNTLSNVAIHGTNAQTHATHALHSSLNVPGSELQIGDEIIRPLGSRSQHNRSLSHSHTPTHHSNQHTHTLTHSHSSHSLSHYTPHSSSINFQSNVPLQSPTFNVASPLPASQANLNSPTPTTNSPHTLHTSNSMQNIMQNIASPTPKEVSPQSSPLLPHSGSGSPLSSPLVPRSAGDVVYTIVTDETDVPKKKRRPRAPAPFLEGMFCHSCGETNTSQWRRGPDGCKSLCNACGIRFANIVNKEKSLPATNQYIAISMLLNQNDQNNQADAAAVAAEMARSMATPSPSGMFTSSPTTPSPPPSGSDSMQDG